MKRALLAAAWLLTSPVMAADLVVVMDDLGYSLKQGERVLALPAPVTLALLPFAPATIDIAHRALETGHEVIVHQPMEPLPFASTHIPGTLTIDMPPEIFRAQIDAALGSVPGAVGINNHTGSRLTQDVASMRRLMHHLAGRDLMFLDSRTTPATVAYSMAREARVPALERDVFLDHEARLPAIEAAFARALTIARRRGHAVIISHPHDVSLAFLARALTTLPDDLFAVTLRALAERDHPATLVRLESPASLHRSLGQ